MMNYDVMEKAAAMVRHEWPDARPACGLILGSGWGDVARAFAVSDSISYEVIPGLGRTGVAGHAGQLLRADHAGLQTLIFQGRRHWYEGEGATPLALPIYVLKQMGAATVVLTNAAGGIREDFAPGDLMCLDDHINMLGINPLGGPPNPFWGPRFADQTTVYDPALREALDRAAAKAGVDLKHGVYIAVSGPTYETPAEIRAWRALGADAVGMSTVPEAMLANAAGLKVLGLSCITNLAAGISSAPLTHAEVTAATRQVMPRMTNLLSKLWEEMANAQAHTQA
ncbi:MAG: purine-nucleoside phosphorylase [Kiritimatiellae bacterium]|nr:purine-nucleoside phosphorylase [Kiritimatiellia bacterium]